MGSLHIIRGLPGSGKTTMANGLLYNWIGAGLKVSRVSRDDLRYMMHGKNWMPVGEVVRELTESRVSLAEMAILRDLLGTGNSVISDNCNLSEQGVLDLAQAARDFGADSVKLHEDCLDVSLDECLRRNNSRINTPFYIPENVITGMADKYSLKKMSDEPSFRGLFGDPDD